MLKFRTRVFCIGETGADCVAGHLDTIVKIKVGHVHRIKNRMWECCAVGLNSDGEPLADFRPAKGGE
jgi:hypothetical protein